jgi:hypothetical protein
MPKWGHPMIKKFLASLGIGLAASAAAQEAPYAPYKESHANFMYNLLFCDDLTLFKNEEAAKDSTLWAPLLADSPEFSTLEKIAADPNQESRVRILAYNRLRAGGRPVPSKQLLGVIVEVPLQEGLDTLAAYPDGRVRYLNQSGKIAIFEGGPPEIEALAKELVAVSQNLVNAIGPWDEKRLPPPRAGNVRITFLVSDGLYFGEGPFQALQEDALGGPVLAKATQLLHAAVGAVVKP